MVYLLYFLNLILTLLLGIKQEVPVITESDDIPILTLDTTESISFYDGAEIKTLKEVIQNTIGTITDEGNF